MIQALSQIHHVIREDLVIVYLTMIVKKEYPANSLAHTLVQNVRRHLPLHTTGNDMSTSVSKQTKVKDFPAQTVPRCFQERTMQ